MLVGCSTADLIKKEIRLNHLENVAENMNKELKDKLVVCVVQKLECKLRNRDLQQISRTSN